VTIERLETFHLGRSLWAELWEREKDLPLVSPLSGYAAHRHPYSTWYWDPGMTLVVLMDGDGRQGLGWTEDGTGAARLILFVGEPEVRDAAVRPPDRPGLGVTLDRERLVELLRA
jgi:hypothetical protein